MGGISNSYQRRGNASIRGGVRGAVSLLCVLAWRRDGWKTKGRQHGPWSPQRATSAGATARRAALGARQAAVAAARQNRLILSRDSDAR